MIAYINYSSLKYTFEFEYETIYIKQASAKIYLSVNMFKLEQNYYIKNKTNYKDKRLNALEMPITTSNHMERKGYFISYLIN